MAHSNLYFGFADSGKVCTALGASVRPGSVHVAMATGVTHCLSLPGDLRSSGTGQPASDRQIGRATPSLTSPHRPLRQIPIIDRRTPVIDRQNSTTLVLHKYRTIAVPCNNAAMLSA